MTKPPSSSINTSDGGTSEASPVAPNNAHGLTPAQASYIAQDALGGHLFNSLVTKEFVLRDSTVLSTENVRDALKDMARAVHAGDLRQTETMLLAQACSLESIYAELATRAGKNLGNNIDVSERYLRLALKAQSQSRATLETLAYIKRPPTLFTHQANIAHGPQQVNNESPATKNDRPARAKKTNFGKTN